MNDSIKQTMFELLRVLKENKGIKEIEIDDKKAEIHVKIVRYDAGKSPL